LNPTYSDLAFSFCAEVEALMRFLRELENPEIGGNTNDACCLRFISDFLVRYGTSRKATYETLHEEHPLPSLESSATIQMVELFISAAALWLHFFIYTP